MWGPSMSPHTKPKGEGRAGNAQYFTEAPAEATCLFSWSYALGRTGPQPRLSFSPTLLCLLHYQVALN